MPELETCNTPDAGWMGDRTRGASLGRSNRCQDRDTAGPFQLRRVHLDSGGYDSGGAYWGLGGQLWEGFTADGEFITFRLDDGAGFAAAETALRAEYPNASATLADGAPDDFANGYIEALFFTSTAPQVGTEEFLTAEHQEAMREGSADGCLPCDVGFDDLHPEALQQILADCQAFQRDNADLLGEAYRRDYDAAQAGRDFWFTRNGHGVGFWDRSQLDADGLGEKLSEAARPFGEVNPFFGNDHVRPDRCVHLM